MATVRDVITAILDRRLPNAGRAFFTAAVESGSWAPVVRGAGTAGTYELAEHQCRYVRTGPLVTLFVDVRLAAVITGGGTGVIQITGVPFAKIGASFPCGSVLLVGIDWTAGANLSLSFSTSSASSTLLIQQTNDNAANTQVDIAGLAASDIIIGTICYETDAP